MRSSVVVVGSINMDLVVHAARHPRVGETIAGGDFHTFPGGKGANQAVAVARLGCNVNMVGRVGDDGFGESLCHTLASEGVDTAHVLQDPSAPTGIALITVDSNGQNTIVVASGANGNLAPEDVASAEEVFQGASVLLVQFECPQPAVAKAIHLARIHGLHTILNPAPARSLEGLPLDAVDYLIPNQTELETLLGPKATGSLHEDAVQMRASGLQRIVVTLGDDGVWVADGADEFHIGAHRVTPVDTTAAGDAFVGAFAVALVEGRSTREAAEWGNAAGALAVTKSGAQPSLPARNELVQFINGRSSQGRM